MNTAFTPLPTTRREFFRGSGGGLGLLAFSQFAPSFLVRSALEAAPAPEKDRSILVLVQLAGGNDGLNTVIPMEDAAYYNLRPTLAVPKAQALRLNATTGLHPSLAALHGLSQSGKLAIVRNVGYPNPNRSHFRSTEIWETASAANESLATGWVGRYLDNACAGQPDPGGPVAVHVTGETPQSFTSADSHPTFGLTNAGGGRQQRRENLGLLRQLAAHDDHHAGGNASFLRATLMDALVTEEKVQAILASYQPDTGANYGNSQFSQALRNVAALIAARLPTRVYYVSLGGFDTHSNQLNTHANNLRTLSEGLAAFQKDLEAKKLDGQVLTMTFSEFGRRPAENQSRGTDHGTAAPLFVLGSRVKGGLHGPAPQLSGLARNQDLTFSTDFRQIYATILDQWLGCPAKDILGGAYKPLGFV